MCIFYRCFIAFFILMMTIPLIFTDLSADRISVTENRMLEKRPSLADMKNSPEIFICQFDMWFKDSTGFREQLIALYQVIDKNKWLNSVTRYTDGQYTFLIGRQGHHYFADVDGALIPKFQGEQFLSAEQLQSMSVKLEEVKTYLDNKGIPLVVMFCADKESVYPEFYPRSIKLGSEPIQLDIITKYIQDNTSVDIFNIRQALLTEKDKYLLYYKIDTMSFTTAFAHYNEIGAFFAYRELMKHINFYFPQMIPFGLDDIEISYDENEIPNVSLKMEKTYKNLDISFFDDVEVFRPFTWENVAYENTESNLPVILFFRDSYASEQYVGKYFAQHFGKAIFIHYGNMRRFEEYIDKYKPDIVIFESSERGLIHFANFVAVIPELP